MPAAPARWQEEDRAAVEAARQLTAALRPGIPVALARVLRHLGLRLQRAALPAGVRGYLVPEADLLRVSARLPAWEQRFVIAHEIGHALARRGALPARPHRRERVCQLFAASLLMPPEALQQAARAGYGRADLVEQLMATFHVSRAALCIQLRRLRLLPGAAAAPTAEERRALLAAFAPALAADLAPPVPLLPLDVDAVYRE